MRARILTVPNQLTLLRLGFLPFFIIAIFYNRYDWALGVLIAAGISDGLDGLLARRLNQLTPLGAYLDPVADKLLLSSSFITLALKNEIEWWLAILVLGRDVLILTASAAILLVAGYRDFPPSLFGKAATLFQILLVLVVIAGNVFALAWLPVTQEVLIYTVTACTVFSGLHYAVVVARRLSHSPG